MNIKSSLGPNDLFDYFLKKCSLILSPVILIVFNKFLKTGTFPDSSKKT